MIADHAHVLDEGYSLMISVDLLLISPDLPEQVMGFFQFIVPTNDQEVRLAVTITHALPRSPTLCHALPRSPTDRPSPPTISYDPRCASPTLVLIASDCF